MFRLVTYTTFLEGKAGDALQVRPRVRVANTWPAPGEVMPAWLGVREHEVMKPSATGASVKVFWLTTHIQSSSQTEHTASRAAQHYQEP